ncbi:hypothetical protein V6N11_017996 [Hibiscus sabdariffa]|uniref:Uncharacterized protein n=1 Tax=Hibiscus sabdariffa TaxID=183260 RepID=A0ABR2T6D1_9ROSI
MYEVSSQKGHPSSYHHIQQVQGPKRKESCFEGLYKLFLSSRYRYSEVSTDTQVPLGTWVPIPLTKYRYQVKHQRGIDTLPQVSIPWAFQEVPIPSLAGTDTQILVLELGTDTTDEVSVLDTRNAEF